MGAALPEVQRITLDTLRDMKRRGEKFAMLTAYDYPTAALAQSAGVHALLIGDSMGCVLLGHANTRGVPLSLMLTLGEAVRRGAPNVYLVGDMPHSARVGGTDSTVTAARRFCDEAGCDAVKMEAAPEDEPVIAAMVRAGVETMAHIGLRPQEVLSAEGYRAQARDAAGIEALVDHARRMEAAGATVILIEAVPAEAGRAVVDAVEVPVIGCGAGPACDGHVLVTQDMLGLGLGRVPRFVPVHAHAARDFERAMRQYVRDIAEGIYPGPEHMYKAQVQER
jgi:3-methyl-2-oxobutanoate hydroxymethyltransferase